MGANLGLALQGALGMDGLKISEYAHLILLADRVPPGRAEQSQIPGR